MHPVSCISSLLLLTPNPTPPTPHAGDDFFPYADGEHAYWTGYFTSRATKKGYIRTMASYLQAARQLEVRDHTAVYLVCCGPAGRHSGAEGRIAAGLCRSAAACTSHQVFAGRLLCSGAAEPFAAVLVAYQLQLS